MERGSDGVVMIETGSDGVVMMETGSDGSEVRAAEDDDSEDGPVKVDRYLILLLMPIQ